MICQANIDRAWAPTVIRKQHIHHGAVTFPEVSDARGCFDYLLHRTELKITSESPTASIKFETAP